jgi:hypothetical protein
MSLESPRCAFVPRQAPPFSPTHDTGKNFRRAAWHASVFEPVVTALNFGSRPQP